MSILCKIFRSYISNRLERKKRIRKQMIDECRKSLDDMRFNIRRRIADGYTEYTLDYIDRAYADICYKTRKRIEKFPIKL